LGVHRFNQIKGDYESALLSSTIDWGRSRAYSLGAGGNIFINLKGREPEGIVQPGQKYKQLCDDIADALSALSDPETGQPIVKRVHRRKEIYHGPFLDQAPDLIIEWIDYAYWGRGLYGSQMPVFEIPHSFDFSDQPLSGAHRPDGVLIIWGSGVRPGVQVEGAGLADLAPTILGLLGAPIPAYMDGSPLCSLFKDEIGAAFEFADVEIDPSSQDTLEYTSEEEAVIEQHLRNLGYL
jgi:predicted AlkP superfamily phosphohydrolase/phosphomutase